MRPMRPIGPIRPILLFLRLIDFRRRAEEHLARVHERFAQRVSTLWQREAWYQKLGLPVEDDGFGYTVEQVATLPRYAMADCLAYYEAVRHATLRYLDGLTPCGL